MQGCVQFEVEKCSEIHPVLLFVREGVSILPPENEMRGKQFDILMRNAIFGRGEYLPFFDIENFRDVSDDE